MGISDYKEPVEVLKISQRGKTFYIGKMVFSDFEDSYTPSPAEYKLNSYSQFAAEDDRFEDLSIGIDEYLKKEKDSIAKGFQRGIDRERTEQIKNYILENEFGIIPNSIIVSVNTIEVEAREDFDASMNDPINKKAILFNNQLFIPKAGKPFLIIDGQHRVEGCKKLPTEIKKEIELIFTFISNADPATQAQLFTTINYKVKPVNKSYLYQILGEFKIESSEYTFLHEIVKLLNEFPRSPLYDRVKMLGRQTSPRNSLSQAFLVETLYLLLYPKFKAARILLSEKDLVKLPIFRYHYTNKDYRKEIPKFILMYLTAIKNKVDRSGIAWENKNEHILLKTVGMGGLINVIPNVYVSLVMKKNLIREQHLINEKIQMRDMLGIIDNLSKINIRNEPGNEFSKGSSQGLVTKCAKKLWSEFVASVPNFVEMQNSYVEWFNQVVVEKKRS